MQGQLMFSGVLPELRVNYSDCICSKGAADRAKAASCETLRSAARMLDDMNGS